MYDWLSERLDAGPVITANQRLARVLTDTWNAQQVARGKTAWQSPAIWSWASWLQRLADAIPSEQQMPVRLTSAQSQVLWEQCLVRELNDPLLNPGALSRLVRETWSRMHEWRVPFEEVEASARSADQRLFVRAANRYRARLEESGWIDDATLPSVLEKLISKRELPVPEQIAFAGYDRVSPQARCICDAVEQAGAQVQFIDTATSSNATLQCFDDGDAELRAAGQWVREQLGADPQRRIAIVVNQLEQDSERCERLIREGLTPGWHGADDSPVDTSYGLALSGYPAIHDSVLALRWLFSDVGGTDVGRLLRSPFLGSGSPDGRHRLELRLRELPDRTWSVDRLVRALRGRDESQAAGNWLDRFATAAARVRDMQGKRQPADWGEFFTECLDILGWPGDASLDSRDYQLIDRWRGLLDEFSCLQLVSGGLTGPKAVARLAAIAADTVYQARNDHAIIPVLGPLEAAGMQFDGLWMAGFGADQWPPAARPLPLMSRELQQRYEMPDATPEDTANYASSVLHRLRSSAAECVFSYPATISDAQQLPSALLADLEPESSTSDPGWYAATLVNSAQIVEATDRVPAAQQDEKVIGGAGTVNRQLSEPFSAFAFGRLGVRWLQEYRPGIAANIRGNLIHDTLRKLYADRPTSSDIGSWSAEQLAGRISAALDDAFGRHTRYADTQLGMLLGLERERAEELMRSVVELDRGRGEFRIVSVEEKIETTIGSIGLSLRSDRIDRLADETCVIFDYKTGATKSFLKSGEPTDMQLVVYASVVDDIVSGIGLYNVDKQDVVISGAGPAITGQDDWDEKLGAWMHEVTEACSQIARGDVRVNRKQNLSDARPLAVLSRFAEMVREH